MAHGIEQIVDRHDQAVISGEAHVLREGGAFYDDSRHWLTSTSPRELHRAVRIVQDAGDTEFAYVVSDGVRIPRVIDGYQRDGIEKVQFLRPDLVPPGGDLPSHLIRRPGSRLSSAGAHDAPMTEA